MGAQDVIHGRQVYSSVINSDAAIVCKEVKVVLDRLCRQSAFNEDEQFDVKVILCELLQNAIRHGNGMDHDKTISLDVKLHDGNTIEISVEDEGTGFDADRILAARRMKAMDACDVFEMDEYGRGLLIIETLCDAVKRNQSGNRITVRKRLHVV